MGISAAWVGVVLSVAFKGALGPVTVTGMEASRVEFYTEHLAQSMSTHGVTIATPKQISALLGMERQKQLLGCSEGNSCLAEIASALGADGVVLGELARLEGGIYQVSLKVVWAHDGRVLTQFAGRAVDEPGLVDLIAKGGALLARDLTDGDWARLTTAPGSHRVMPVSRVRVLAWVPLALGVAAAGISAVGFARVASLSGQLASERFASDAEARAVAGEGKTWQGVAFTMAAVAAVGLAVSAFMFFASDSLQATAMVTPLGAQLGLAGAW